MANYRKCELCNELINNFPAHQRTCRVKNRRESRDDADIPIQAKVYFRNKRGENSAAVSTALYTLCYIKPLFQSIIKGYSGCNNHQEDYVCLSCILKRIFEEFLIKSNASGDPRVAYEIDVSAFYAEISSITDNVIGENTPSSDTWYVITETLNILHHIYVQPEADENNPATAILCNERCPGHLVCDFRIKETMKCQCSKTFSYVWNYSEFSYPVYLASLKPNLPADSSKTFFGIPKYRLVDHSASSAILPILKKMPSLMRYQWENIDSNECEDESCEIKISKRKAELISNPRYFFSSIIWEKEKEPDSLESLQVLSTVANNISLSEIFITPLRDNYLLKYMIFCNEKSSVLVIKREDDQWELIEGNTKNIIVKWEKVIEEVLIKNLSLAGLVYEVSEKGEGLEISELKWLNLEKLAVEEKVYKEQHKVNEDHIGIDANAGYINKQKQATLNIENLNKDEYIDLKEDKKINQDFKNIKPQETKYPSLDNPIKSYQEATENIEIKNKAAELERGRKEIDLRIKNLRMEEDKNQEQFQELKNQKADEEAAKEKKWYSDYLRADKTQEETKKEEMKNSWRCSCGADNEELWEVCVKCNKIKEGTDGWACKFCTAINYDEHRYRCSVCFEIQLGDQPSANEYWNCSLCGAANVSSVSCSNCRELKITDKWKCDKCANINYSWDKECSKCLVNERKALSNSSPARRREITIFTCKSCKSDLKSVSYKYCWTCKRATDLCEHSKYPGAYICWDCQKEIWRCSSCRKENLPSNSECENCMGKKYEERKEEVDENSCSVCHRELIYSKYCPKCFKTQGYCMCSKRIFNGYLCTICSSKAEREQRFQRNF